MRITSKHILVLLFVSHFIFSFFFFIRAQPAGARTFTLQDGSLSPKINCLIQSSQGYLLLGSANGLFRFNGLVFEKIPLDTFIGSQNITAICQVKPGEIWLGFQNGALGLLTNRSVARLSFEEGKPAKAITKILADSSGNIWCGTAGEGLYCHKNRRWVNFNLDDGMSDAYVYDIALAGKNGVVCGTDDGVNFCGWKDDKKEVRVSKNTAKPLDKIIRRVLAYRKNSYRNEAYPAYLAGTQDYITGLFYLNDLHVTSAKQVAYHSSQTNAIAQSAKNVWIGTEADGVWFFGNPDKAGTEYLCKKWVARNKVQNLLVDDQQHLWLSSDHELIRTEGDQLMQLWPLSDTGVKQCHAILASKQNGALEKRIWYNDQNGLKEIIFRDHAKETEVIDHPISAISNNTEITSLYEDNYNNIWIGTMGKGILLLNRQTGAIKTITEDQLLINGSILSITGNGNDIWISSLGGAVKCTIADNGNDYSFTNYNEISGIGTNYIYNIFIDRKGRVWFATDGKGLTKLENGKFTNYDKTSGLRSEVVYSIAEDKQGLIWVNTLNDGLYCFNGKTFSNFSTADGLSDNNIASMLSDDQGHIVAISSKAIDVIDPVSGAVQTFDAEQGLTNINTDLHCTSVSADGTVIFCSASGLHELSIAANIRAPQAFIERTTLFLDDFNASEKTDFNAGENNISIHFNAIDLSHPARIRFQYMLQGLSKEWITTKDHYVNYPKLPPGTYSFRVRASLSDAFNYSPEAMYSFTIARPLWQKWWFIGLMILLLAAGVWWLVRYREAVAKRWQQLQKENLQSRLDTLQSQVSPHFFFNSLNTLIALIEEEPKMAVAYTNHLSDFFRKVVQYREKDSIPLAEEVALINDYFFIQQKRFGRGIRLINNIPGEILEAKKIAPLSLQLLAENAIKHNAFTQQQPLLLELSVNENEWLVIKNNLQAKQNQETGAGMGLQNIQRRYKLLTGKDVEVEKTDLSFIVKIPLI
ncbi:MAG: two-component regulator propeller domain-containing protein [Bacteroidota bacterium]